MVVHGGPWSSMVHGIWWSMVVHDTEGGDPCSEGFDTVGYDTVVLGSEGGGDLGTEGDDFVGYDTEGFGNEGFDNVGGDLGTEGYATGTEGSDSEGEIPLPVSLRSIVADIARAESDHQIFRKAEAWWTMLVFHDVPVQAATAIIEQAVDWVRGDGSGWSIGVDEFLAMHEDSDDDQDPEPVFGDVGVGFGGGFGDDADAVM